MKTTHELLKSQIERYLGDGKIPEAVRPFLDIINQTYWRLDEENSRLEAEVRKVADEFSESESRLIEEKTLREKAETLHEMFRDDLESLVDERTAQLLKTNRKLQLEIENRNQIEKSLEEADAWRYGLFNSMTDAVFIADKDRKIINLNSSAVEMFGYRLDELNKRSADILFAEEDLYNSFRRQLDAYILHGESAQIETMAKRKNQTIFPVEVRISQLHDAHGDNIGFVGVVRNVSKRVREQKIKDVLAQISRATIETQNLEELLGKIHNLLNLLLDAEFFYVALYDEEKDIYFFPFSSDIDDDDSFSPQQLKHSLTDYVRRTGETLLANDEEFRHLESIGEVELVGEPSHSWLGVPLRVADSGVFGVVVLQSYNPEFLYSKSDLEVVERVSEQISLSIQKKRAEENLIASEAKNHALLTAIPDLIFVLDKEGVFLDYKSASMDDLYSQPRDFLGKSIESTLPPDLSKLTLKKIGETLADNSIHVFEYSLKFDEKEHFFEARMVPLGSDRVLSIVRNITEQKLAEDERLRLEAKIQHAQKLESLGVLAGGIAHDFNNLLVGILGNAGLALMKMKPESPTRQIVERIETAALRASDLTKQMLAYSGKGKFIIEPLNLSKMVEEMAHLLEISISKNAVLKYEFAESIPPIEGDATQIRQVIMNLITNGSEAIGSKSGYIAIRTGVMYVDENYTRGTYYSDYRKNGYYVFLEVSDTGCGMDEETVNKMFDPFFTTKFTGRGLGLAAVLGIIRSHQGAVKVYSEKEKGTTIKVLFPRLDEEGDVAGAIESEGVQNEKLKWSGTGVVLVVDDDETVRSVAKMILEEAGFGVITANDGREAVELFKSQQNIELVLLDMTMPHMNGEDCFCELRRIDPDVKVILSSGYNEQDATNRFAGKGLAGFIQKPYPPQDLIDVVMEVVNVGEKPE